MEKMLILLKQRGKARCKYQLYPGEHHTVILVSRLSKTTQFMLSHLRFTSIIVVRTTSFKFACTKGESRLARTVFMTVTHGSLWRRKVCLLWRHTPLGSVDSVSWNAFSGSYASSSGRCGSSTVNVAG